MIISGGSDTSQVEVIAPSGNVSCSLPRLPTEHGRFHHTQDGSLVCGGYPYFDWPQTCVTLTSAGWAHSHTLQYPRYRHTSWAVEDGVILIGGFDLSNFGYAGTTAELVKFDGTTEEIFRLSIFERTL